MEARLLNIDGQGGSEEGFCTRGLNFKIGWAGFSSRPSGCARITVSADLLDQLLFSSVIDLGP
jgi:hypothetical protein